MKKTILLAIFICILLALVLNFFYRNLVVSDAQSKFGSTGGNLYVGSGAVKKDYNLTKDAYLLRIKHTIHGDQPKQILVNGTIITQNVFKVRKRGIIETSYVYLPRDAIREGKNSFEIVFGQNQPQDVTLFLTNYRQKIGRDIFILFRDSKYLPSGKIDSNSLIAVFVLILLSLAIVYFLKEKVFSLATARYYYLQIFSLLPFVSFLLSIWIGGQLSGIYRVVLDHKYFMLLGMGSFVFVESMTVFYMWCQSHKTLNEIAASFKDSLTLSTVEQKGGFKLRLKDFLRTYKIAQQRLVGNDGYPSVQGLSINIEVMYWTLRAMFWFRSLVFSKKCVVLFMVAMSFSAFFMLLDLKLLTELFAKIGFFILVAGVMNSAWRYLMGTNN